MDPGVVGAVTRGPDDRLDVELGSVLEADRVFAGAGGARAQVDAVAALELAQAGAEQQVSPLGAAAPAAVKRCRDQAEMVAVEVHAAAEQSARQAGDLRALGQVHAVGRGDVLGDLGSGVGRSDDEHLAGGELAGVAVAGAVQLGHRAAEFLRQRRHPGPLVGTSRDDHLRGLVLTRLRGGTVAAIGALQRGHPAVVPDRQLECPGIVFEVVRDLVLAREVLRAAGKRQAREGTVAGGREQLEGVPAPTPRIAGTRLGVEDHERDPRPGEVVAGGESCLAAADHDDLGALGHGQAPPAAARRAGRRLARPGPVGWFRRPRRGLAADDAAPISVLASGQLATKASGRVPGTLFPAFSRSSGA